MISQEVVGSSRPPFAVPALTLPVQSPWRIPLVREIAVILVVKLALLMAIKVIWFDHPALAEEGQQRVVAHLLGAAGEFTEDHSDGEHSR